MSDNQFKGQFPQQNFQQGQFQQPMQDFQQQPMQQGFQQVQFQQQGSQQPMQDQFQQQGFQQFQQQGFEQPQQSFQQPQQGFQQPQQGFEQPQQTFQQQSFQQPMQGQFQQGFGQQMQGQFQQPNGLMQTNTPVKGFSKQKLILFGVIVLIFVIIAVVMLKKNASQQPESTPNELMDIPADTQESSSEGTDTQSEAPTEDSGEATETPTDGETSETPAEGDTSAGSSESVDLVHGQSYNYSSGSREFTILNDRVELFKKVNVKEKDAEELVPSKGNVYLGVFLSVENKSSEDDFVNMMFQGYADDEGVDTAYTLLHEIEGYDLDYYVPADSTKKICLLYEVPKDIQKFELRDNLGLSLNIPLKKDDAKGDDER